jgi:hypothetical protein
LQHASANPQQQHQSTIRKHFYRFLESIINSQFCAAARCKALQHQDLLGQTIATNVDGCTAALKYDSFKQGDALQS